jgi:hypothetical protein
MLLTSKFYSSWLGMINSLMGLTIIMAAILGVLLADKRLKPLLIGLWAGYALFGLAWPYQYTTHDYYHITLIAIVGLSIVPFIDRIIPFLKQQPLIWRLGAIGLFVFASGYSLWVARSEIYVGNNYADPIAWKAIGEAIPENSTFVALTDDYGYRLMYYGWREPTVMWPGADTLEMQAAHGNSALNYTSYFASLTDGKDYFLVTGSGVLNQQPALKQILSGYSIYKQTSDFTLYDLKHPLSSSVTP